MASVQRDVLILLLPAEGLAALLSRLGLGEVVGMEMDVSEVFVTSCSL